MKKNLFSWEAIIGCYLILLTVFLCAGCSTTHTARIGDTTYHVGFHLDKYEVQDID